jgi:hypothetical protein
MTGRWVVCGAFDARLIVAKHIVLGHDWYTKVSEQSPVFNQFLSGMSSCDKLVRPVLGGLDCGLFLRDPL